MSEVSTPPVSAGLLWRVFLRLGLTSFGGPAAHLGYFHDEFVKRRGWLTDARYAEVVALCQLLPGPASSQVGLAIGYLQRGYQGAALAWLGFTLPSALLMALFAFGLAAWPDAGTSGWVHGLKLLVVAVVAQAVWQMGRNLCPDRARQSLALAVAAVLLASGGLWLQLVALAVAALVGVGCRFPGVGTDSEPLVREQRRPWRFLVVFLGLLVLSLLPWSQGSLAWLAAELYRAGALVFGGGHVVLPWLQEGFVASGAMPADSFLAGYGAAQAVPGPLFTFSAFLGASVNGVDGALVALVAVFLPGTLLVFAGLPLWSLLRHHAAARSALAGVNAGVVGLLLAVLYDPVWTAAVWSPADLAAVLLLWLALAVWRQPVWLLAPLSAAVGGLLW